MICMMQWPFCRGDWFRPSDLITPATGASDINAIARIIYPEHCAGGNLDSHRAFVVTYRGNNTDQTSENSDLDLDLDIHYDDAEVTH